MALQVDIKSWYNFDEKHQQKMKIYEIPSSFV